MQRIHRGCRLPPSIWRDNGTLTVTDSTLSGNTAAQGGRGIFNLGDTIGKTTTSTSATATITNTIIGQSDTTVLDFMGQTAGMGTSTTSGSTNLIRTQSGFAGNIVSTADPVLSGLANNGGLTATMALGASSPAVNTGTAAGAPTTDQRGLARVGNVDIGAFEYPTSGVAPQTMNFGPWQA